MKLGCQRQCGAVGQSGTKGVRTAYDRQIDTLLPVLGAIIVAAIAAVTAQRRLRQQLLHDRELRDLDELRALLDECVQVIGQTAQAFLRYGWFVRPPELKDETGTDPPYVPKSPAEAIQTFDAQQQPIFGLYQRIILRLGREHAVSQAILGAQGAAAMSMVFMDEDLDPRDATKEMHEEWQRLAQSFQVAHFVLLDAAQRLVGSRIKEDPSLARSELQEAPDVDLPKATAEPEAPERAVE